MEKTRIVLVSILGVLLLMAYLYIQTWSMPFHFAGYVKKLAMPYDLNGLLSAWAYFATYILAIMAIIMMVFLRSSLLAWLLLIPIALAYSIDLWVQWTGKSALGLAEGVPTNIMPALASLNLEAFWGSPLAYAAGVFVALLVVFAVLRSLTRYYPRISSPSGLLFLLVVIVGIAILVSKHAGLDLSMYPAPIKAALLWVS